MTDKTIDDLTSASGTVAADEIELWDVSAAGTVKDTLTNALKALDPVTAARGGTGLTTYAVGDLIQASATTPTLAKLTAVATGNALISGGLNTVSSWGKIGLTTHVSGTLPVANGGTNLTGYTAGDIVYCSATDVLSKLAKNTSSTRVLTNTGASNIPAWAQVDLTTGVTGTLPVANGGNIITGVKLDSDMAGYSTAALQDMTNMSFSVLNTHHYSGKFLVEFRVAATNTGAGFALTGPTGTYGVMCRIQNADHGVAGAFLMSASSGTGSGVLHSHATIYNSAVQVFAIIEFLYSCTADGTLKLQYRPILTTALTVKAGTMGYIRDLGV